MKTRTVLTQSWQAILAGFVAAAIGASSASATDYVIDGTGGGGTNYATLQDLHTAQSTLTGSNSITLTGNAAVTQTLNAAFAATTDPDDPENEMLLLKSDLNGNRGIITRDTATAKTRFITNGDNDYLHLSVFHDANSTPSEFTISGFTGTADATGAKSDKSSTETGTMIARSR